MRDELTTKMHGEFLGEEYTEEELAVMGVTGAMNRGLSLEEALNKYGLTEARYKEIFEGVFGT